MLWFVIRLFMFTDLPEQASVTLIIYKEALKNYSEINLRHCVTKSRQAEHIYPSGGFITLTVIKA